MRMLTTQKSTFKRFWTSLLKRDNLDTTRVRNDALTLKVFGRPVSVQEAVHTICQDVRTQGDRAVVRYVQKLEGARLSPATLKVSRAERRAAAKRLDPTVRQAIEECADHIRQYHLAQVSAQRASIRRAGVKVFERCRPLERAGIYVPGGNAPLISTVLMNAIPAAVAGVPDIIMATPSSEHGTIADALMVAADIAGVKDIFRVGGAVAVASLAYGTQTIPRVDKIVGPGNIFATEAKRQVVGQVGIDHLAGPSEILIVADDTADSKALAWDLLGQCEHGSGAVSLLLTPSAKLLAAVRLQVAQRVKEYPAFSRIHTGIQLIQVRSLREALVMTNEYAPEHLSLQFKHAAAYVKDIENSGAIFVGSITPQAMGDYTAGPNHVLPTGGTSRSASPLSVRDFVHYTSVIEYTRVGVKREGAGAATVAEAEGLKAHAQSIRVRM